jgi:hypothetical protein
VKPLPILQIVNLVFGIFFFAWEWPLGFIAGTALHRSIEARLVLLPLTALASALLYQATNPAIYYTVGMGVYFWAYSEGEVRPLTLYYSWNKALTVYLDCGRKAMEPSSSCPPWKSLDGLSAFLPGLLHYPPGCNRCSSFRHLAGRGCDSYNNVHTFRWWG